MIGVLYTLVQWGGASQIGPSHIFSKSRGTDRAQFAEMVDSINMLAHTCDQHPGGRRALRFDDFDVVTPYLQSGEDGAPGTCTIMRQTDVTRFAEQDWKTCGFTFVHEITPGRPNVESNPDPTRWTSTGGRYGYFLFSPRCSK